MCRLAYLLLIVLFQALFVGCGGGTTGTSDIESTGIVGKLVNVSGDAVGDAVITVLQTGDSALTSASGDFEIEAALSGGEVTLAVELGTVSATVSLGAIPEGTKRVDVRLQLDAPRNTVTVVTVDIKAPPVDNTPDPAATSVGDIPAATATPTDSAGQPTPAPLPTLTTSPAPTESATPAPPPTITTSPAPTESATPLPPPILTPTRAPTPTRECGGRVCES